MAAAMPGHVMHLLVLTGAYALFQAANNTAVMHGAPAGGRGLYPDCLDSPAASD